MKKSGKTNGNNKKRTFKINSKATIKELVNFDNNTDVKVSIIVPICNVEKFLKKCLDSIEVQTLKDIEIICINDGSKDSSLDIIKSYSNRDSRFKIVDKENSGYGDSLNIGLSVASGKYIGIVESDDFIDPKMFETLFAVAEEKRADIVKSNFFLYWENGKDGNGGEINELHEISTIEEDRLVITPLTYEGGKIFSAKASIWSAIYNREYLNKNNICFLPTPGASFQDTSFTFKAFSSTDKMVLIHDAFLHYRQDNAGSSVNNLDKKKHCVLEEYAEIFDYIDKNDDEAKDMLKVATASFYDACTWAYERLSQELRYSYICELSDLYKKILQKIPAAEIPFGECWWKTDGIQRIANNPFEYHVWREVERYEQSAGVIEYVEEMKKSDTFLAGKKSLVEKNVNPRFSIIIPAYNCEHYLQACLESIRGQAFTNFEVICVNDGSMDQTLDIIKYYAAVDSRISYIDITNHGPSYARNLGIKQAKGQYILFMDSDDFYNVDSLEILNQKIEESNPDVVTYSANVYPIHYFNDWYESTLHGQNNTFGKLTVEDILANPYLGVYIWKCAYRREMLISKKLCFDQSMKYGEDALFLMKVLLESEKTVSLSNELYNYRVENTNSLMQTIWSKPNEYALTQNQILDKTLKLMYKYGTKPSAALFEYSCNLVYGGIDGSSGETRIKAIKQFISILRKYKLYKCVEQSKDSAKGFYNYCINEINAHKADTAKPSFIKLGLRRILPVSRQSYYDYEAKKIECLEREIQALNNLQNDMNSMRNEIDRLNHVIADINAGNDVNCVNE